MPICSLDQQRQIKALFKAYQAIAESAAFVKLETAQQKIISNALKDFQLSGINLESDKQQRYKEISQQLSELCSRYSDNVLDATNEWIKLITNADELKGLPDSALEQAKQAAEQVGHDGWLINLQFPSYIAVMTYADNRDLRHVWARMQHAYLQSLPQKEGCWESHREYQF